MQTISSSILCVHACTAARPYILSCSRPRLTLCLPQLHPAGLLREPHHTPTNPDAVAALSALLTQSLAARLAEPDPRPLLVCLNSSLETAQVIWNSSMREELSKVCVWVAPACGCELCR